MALYFPPVIKKRGGVGIEYNCSCYHIYGTSKAAVICDMFPVITKVA